MILNWTDNGIYKGDMLNWSDSWKYKGESKKLKGINFSAQAVNGKLMASLTYARPRTKGVTVSAEISPRPLNDRASWHPAFRQWEFYKFFSFRYLNKMNYSQILKGKHWNWISAHVKSRTERRPTKLYGKPTQHIAKLTTLFTLK